MNRTFKNTALAFAAVLLGVWPAEAQAGSGATARAGYLYEDVEALNLWLSTSNVAGMRQDSLSISDATLNGSYAQGDLALSPRRQWNAGAQARSITHLQNFSMVGSFGFDQQSTYEHCGSMFLRPGLYPVDILEFTPGTKSLQNYSFTGGISVDLAPEWRIGAEVDFSSANYTKLKDLRYTNYILDLSLRPGIVWHSADGLQAGLSLRIDRNAETVDPEQVGAAANSYQAFLDKGLHYGLGGIWTNESLHLDDDGSKGFPVRSMSYGAALQLGGSDFIAEISYMYTDGKIGEKDAIWYQYPQHKVSALVGKNFTTGSTKHTTRLEAEFSRLNLQEAIMEKATVGGITLRQIYGYNSIFCRSQLHVGASWRAVRPGKFNLEATMSYKREDGLSSIKYPVVCGETLQKAALGICGRLYAGKWSIPAALSFAKGFLTELYRSAESGLPQRQEDYYEMWQACNTGFDLHARLGVRRTFRQGIFIEAGADFRTVAKAKSCGGRLTLGYVF